MKENKSCFCYPGVPTFAMLMSVCQWLEPYTDFKLWRPNLNFGGTRTIECKRNHLILRFDRYTLVRIKGGSDIFSISHFFLVWLQVKLHDISKHVLIFHIRF